jgi:hypothetical protein
MVSFVGVLSHIIDVLAMFVLCSTLYVFTGMFRVLYLTMCYATCNVYAVCKICTVYHVL